MELDEPLDNREPEAQATVRPLERLAALHERREELWEHVRIDPYAAVTDVEHRRLAVPCERYGDAAPRRREFYRIGEQVAYHLHEARRVGDEPQRLARELQLERDPARFEAGRVIFDRVPRKVAEIDRFAMEIDPAARDPRDVQQVIDDPDEADTRTLIIASLPSGRV
jgi:hypothetical protein